MKIIDISDGTHTLGAELAFLDGLGTYSDVGKRCAKTNLLDGYLAGLVAKRVRGFNRRKRRSSASASRSSAGLRKTRYERFRHSGM